MERQNLEVQTSDNIICSVELVATISTSERIPPLVLIAVPHGKVARPAVLTVIDAGLAYQLMFMKE